MTNLFSFTSYSYPKSESLKEISLSSFSAGILIYLMLISLQPFGTESFQHPYKYLLLFPYTIIFSTAFLIINVMVSSFSNWNLGSELVKIWTVLLLGSVGAYFYNTLCLSHVKLSFENYFYMLFYCLAIGIPVSVIYVLSRYIYLKTLHKKTAEDIPQPLSGKTTVIESRQVIISAGNEKLSIPEDCFLYAQSMENYCILFFSENQTIKKHMIRISLANLLDQIESPAIKKCHRSYIVNLNKVIHSKGNAQGYRLTLPENDIEVPVSRSFISTIIPELKQYRK
ncbi:LytTR family DNA-binding domain-containing protein [Chryseobacterium sp.]|uniref:LytTR family DNA-binding domain-containing protein n=1 Tax=Chryseobacterium sp. TaxID=1871047 RepID=UPI0025C45D9E|nr:LytTR family DNA-binding domain-containing protein [Chryseobacterium sp.]MBV8324772.1 LytTR family transcriptional regulator [Chryseobacterium sp.]